MSGHSNAQDLLQVARDELVKQLLPALPASLRYQALMVANAMAIAARECQTGREATQAELSGLQNLLHETVDARQAGGELQQSLQALRRKLAAEIRLGKFDAPDARRAELLAHLAASAANELAISNPKMLAGRPTA